MSDWHGEGGLIPGCTVVGSAPRPQGEAAGSGPSGGAPLFPPPTGTGWPVQRYSPRDPWPGIRPGSVLLRSGKNPARRSPVSADASCSGGPLPGRTQVGAGPVESPHPGRHFAESWENPCLFPCDCQVATPPAATRPDTGHHGHFEPHCRVPSGRQRCRNDRENLLAGYRDG